MKGNLIVIDGLDGCGKSTQLELISKKLPGQYKFISFPNYESPSGQIIKDYLSGMFDEENSDIGCYSASSFYAIDRYISYKTTWSVDYINGDNIITARYTTSNAIYQMAKLPKEQWDSFLNWLFDYEYVKLGIPKPDKVIFLDMPIDVSQKLLSNRYSGDESKKDIHEKNIDFMRKCREAALYVGSKYDWSFVNCSDGNNPLDIEHINNELLDLISNRS